METHTQIPHTIAREQAEADLCMEPLDGLAKEVMHLFRTVGRLTCLPDLAAVTFHFNLHRPHLAPETEARVWTEGVLPLVERGWVTVLRGEWCLTEAGRRAKHE